MSTAIHHHVLRSVSLSTHPCICPSTSSSSYPSIYLATHAFIWSSTLLAIFRSSDLCVHLSRRPSVFKSFWLRNVLRATTPCTFSTSQLPKVLRDRQFLALFTSKCASRHNGVHFFDISTSKSAPRPPVFSTFYFQMCFAPQRRALFRHLNFQKWSGPGVFCTFWLGNLLRATTACTFSTSQLPKAVRSWGVLYLLTSKSASRHNGVQLFISHLPWCLRTRRFSEPTFQPSGATKPRKNTVFRDFPTFSRTCIFFLLIFSLLTLLPADCFFISPYCRKVDF